MSFKKSKILLSIISIVLSISIPSNTYAKKDELNVNVERALKKSNGKIGISILGLEDNYKYSYNGNKHFPMQSVYKFPIAMAVLDQVDKGLLSLDKKVYIAKEKLHKTHSPIRDKYPNGNIYMSIADLLKYTVSVSDNNGCDILLEEIGGTQKAEEYIHSLGIKGIAIKASEYEMSQGWNVQYTNWSEPDDMAKLLSIFFKGTALSKTSNDFLMKIMEETSTGPKRIRGLIPLNTTVAHKTGSSGTNEKGITAATNDVGIITLPNGKHFVIVLYVSDSPATTQQREYTMAKITKLAWNHFSNK